jgi:hypothetical protein
MSDKLSPRSDKCLFVGYPKETKWYYFYFKSENKIIVARHAVFLEKECLTRGSCESSVQLQEIQEVHESVVGDDSTIPPMFAEPSGSGTPELGSENMAQEASEPQVV